MIHKKKNFIHNLLTELSTSSTTVVAIFKITSTSFKFEITCNCDWMISFLGSIDHPCLKANWSKTIARRNKMYTKRKMYTQYLSKLASFVLSFFSCKWSSIENLFEDRNIFYLICLAKFLDLQILWYNCNVILTIVQIISEESTTNSSALMRHKKTHYARTDKRNGRPKSYCN